MPDPAPHPAPAPAPRRGRPGPPPRAWLAAVAALPPLVLLASWLLVRRGLANHGRADAYFREGRTGTDLSAVLLAGSAALAWTVARRLGPSPHARFWLLAAATLLLAALDDRLGLHELADRGINALLARHEDDPLTDHIDDALVGLYGVAALAVAWRHRAHLLALPWFTGTMAAAGALFAAMIGLDLFGGDARMVAEETVKLLAGALILAAMLAARAEARR